MGADRNNLTALQHQSRKSFKDPDVCHFHILDFCPHDLFPNTKSDIGICPNKHSDSFKEQFRADPDHEYYKWVYEEEFMDKLQRLIGVVEQRIRKGNERILGPDEQQVEREKEKKLDAVKAEVSAILKLAEEAGETGNIADAEAHTAKANELRRNIDLMSITPIRQISTQEKSLRVCDTCGAMQSLGDAASRFESHIAGKQHVGYELIRSTLAKLREIHSTSTMPQLKSAKRGRSSSHHRDAENSRAESDLPSKSVNGEEKSTERSRCHRRSSSMGRHSPRGQGRESPQRRYRTNDRYDRRDGPRRSIDRKSYSSRYRSSSYERGKNDRRGSFNRHRSYREVSNERSRSRDASTRRSRFSEEPKDEKRRTSRITASSQSPSTSDHQEVKGSCE